MYRRSLLALGVGTAAATAGCLSSLGIGGPEKPILVRAMRAEGDETDVTCTLPESFVSEHEALASSLQKARDAPVHEWQTTAVTLETGEELSHEIEHQCDVTGGIYHYRDQGFFVSITPKGTSTVGLDHGDDDHSHGDDDGHDHDSHDHDTTTEN